MTRAVVRPLTFIEFLEWDAELEQNFELVDGYPIPIQDPNANHEDVVERLNMALRP